MQATVAGASQRTPTDQYVALVQSTTVAGRIVDKVDLAKVHDEDLRLEARKERGVKAEAGGTAFVPEEMNKTTFGQRAKDWTQILAQFGLGIAAINTLK